MAQRKFRWSRFWFEVLLLSVIYYYLGLPMMVAFMVGNIVTKELDVIYDR